MALNEIFRDADYLSLPVPAGTKSGAPVRVGGLNGVCQTNRNEGTAPTDTQGPDNTGNPVGNATVWLKGGWEFQTSFAVATVGLPIYITPAGALAATDGTGANFLFGHALTTKAAAAGPLTVRIAN